MTYFLKNLDLSKLQQKRKKRTGRKPLNPFPVKLYKMLMDLAARGMDDIASWGPDGASFLVHDTQRLVSEALPAYFNQSKYKSFQRQLNFYGFNRVMDGPLEGSYSHPLFRRGEEAMCHKISRKEHHQSQLSSSQAPLQIRPQDIIIPERTPEEEEDVFFTAPQKPQQQQNRVSLMENTNNTNIISVPQTPQEKCNRLSLSIEEAGDMEPRAFEPPALLFHESILTLPPTLKSQQSSMFMLPAPHLNAQESILANGHTAHNFGKSFFFVEDGLQHTAV